MTLELTSGVGSNQWAKLTHGWTIVGYVPVAHLIWDATEAPPTSHPAPNIRPEVIAKARRILQEHKDVWDELAKY